MQIDIVGGAFTLQGLKVSLDSAASQAAPTVAVSGLGNGAYSGSVGTIAQAGNHLVDVEGLLFDITGNHAQSQAVAKVFIAALS